MGSRQKRKKDGLSVVKPFEALPKIMDDQARRVGAGVTAIMRKAGSAVDREVVFRTPVDKGEARSNWVGTLNSAFTGTILPYAPGRKLGIGEQANAQAAIAQAAGAIQRYDVNRDRSIHITNNVGHIGPLNSGSSTQAPAMFVQMGVQAGLVAIRGARVLPRR